VIVANLCLLEVCGQIVEGNADAVADAEVPHLAAFAEAIDGRRGDAQEVRCLAD
jgi:hypothetical protein